jgi:penicillin amidase
MTTKYSWLAGALGVALAACSSPHLALVNSQALDIPAGTGIVLGAFVQDSNGQVLWSLDGPGVLTPTAGLQVVYYAPPTYPTSGPTTATVTLQLTGSPDETKAYQITITKPSNTIGGIANLQAQVDVGYDTRSIPTINCVAPADCYAVLGYIHARDRFFEMDFLRRAARGTLSELIGALATDQDISSRTIFTVPVPGSSPAAAQPLADQLATYLRADPLIGPLFAAYVAGINKRISEIRNDPTQLPADYAQLLYAIDPTSTTDLPDWTDVDTVAIFRLQQFQLSENISGKLDQGLWAAAFAGQGDDATAFRIRAWIRAKMSDPSYTLSGSGAPNAPPFLVAGPSPSTTAHLRDMGPLLQQAKARVLPLEQFLHKHGEPAGSNNWVIDGAHSATGKAMVANDPHLTLQYPALFHLAHLVASSTGLNVMGGSFPGVPVTLIGRGAHVGWGVTVVGYDVTEVYQETLGPPAAGGIPTVMYKGSPVPCAVSVQNLGVRTSAGIGTQQVTVLVVPHHGPVVALDKDHGVAYSVRWTGNNPATDDARAFYRLNNAASVADAVVGLDGDPKDGGGNYTGYYTGAQNFVLADDQGNIAYDPHACAPLRPWATSIAVYPLPNVPVPGSSGMLEWADNFGLPLCVPNAQLPKAIGSDKGFLATANSDPMGTTDDNDPYENNPGNVPYLSYNWTDPVGFRIARIQDVLSAKTADAGTVSLDDVHALQTDHTMYLARPFLAAITAADAIHSSDANLAAGATLLAAWSLDCPTGLAGITPGTSPSSLAALDPQKAPNDPDATHSTDSAACLLFHTFLRKVIDSTFSDEAAVAGIGVDVIPAVQSLVYLLSTEGQASNPTNLLCSDVAKNGSALVTVANKTCTTQVLNALSFAYARLKNTYGDQSNWRWGRVHTLTFTHPLYPLVDQGFNPGPFARPGGASTVDVANPSGGDPNNLSFSYGEGSNVRWAAVMDGTVPNTTFQLPGLESGAPFTPNTPGMLGDYLTNTYFQWPFQASDVVSIRTESYTP